VTLDEVITGSRRVWVKAVGIKQLNAHLSDHIRLAKAGEVVLVTEREEVAAELRPARRHLPAATSEDDVFDAPAEDGKVERASMSRETWRWSTKGLIDRRAPVREGRAGPGGTLESMRDLGADADIAQALSSALC